MNALRTAAVTVFGLGLMRPASGTWGSTPPPGLAWIMLLLGAPLLVVNAAMVAVGVLFATACVMLGRWAQQRFGREDPGQVVADETAGQCIALLLLPWRPGPEHWLWNGALAATSFFAFRFFDILKPPPVRQLERLPGGWGILADDLAAGVYALAVTHLLAWQVWPRLLG